MFQLRTLAVLSLFAAGAATAAVLPGSFSPQDDQDGGAPPMALEPTAVHKWLLEGVGEWAGTMNLTMPGMDEMSVEATETVTALGPYHTMSDFRCDFFGQPYHGHGVTGYNPETKKMHGTWTDNMSPHTSIMTGTADLKTGTTIMTYMAPAGDGSGLVKHRNVMHHQGDSYSMEFFMGEGDAAVQTMTIAMKRKK